MHNGIFKRFVQVLDAESTLMCTLYSDCAFWPALCRVKSLLTQISFPLTASMVWVCSRGPQKHNLVVSIVLLWCNFDDQVR